MYVYDVITRVWSVLMVRVRDEGDPFLSEIYFMGIKINNIFIF